MPPHDEGRPGQGGLQDQAKIHPNGTTPDAALDAFLGTVGATRDGRRNWVLARDGFTAWLLGQIERDDWVGDLARDVAYDTTWPRHATRLRDLHDYLYDLHGLDEAHAALDQAWAEWRGVTA